MGDHIRPITNIKTLFYAVGNVPALAPAVTSLVNEQNIEPELLVDISHYAAEIAKPSAAVTVAGNDSLFAACAGQIVRI